MAGQRKLLGEIDRTLKKVSEGVDVFNDIWDKVYAATAQNQKEKHEADLKKEIKKLQRFRDQIKNWVSNSDVKDKRPLIEARKLIEQKMEEFKVCEKETKTKAYSKEGLAQVEKLDPAEQARQNTKGWILDALTQLNEQIESFECDLERMAQQKGRNSQRNKAEKENLEALLGRHKWHILKLEQINRLLDNHALEPGEVDDIKDDIEYYLEANQEEPDFLETYDDCLYDVLDLDALGAALQVGHPDEQGGGEDGAEDTASTTSTPSTTSRSKTPKKPVAATIIASIGRPGAVKPAELKSTATPSSTPGRSASVKSPAAAGLTTPGGKSDDSMDSARSEDKTKGSRTTPQRARAEPAVTTPTAVRAQTPQSQTRSRVASPAPAASVSATPPTVLEVVAAKRKVSPEKASPAPAPSTTSPLPQASAALPPTVPVSASVPTQPTMSAILSGATSASPRVASPSPVVPPPAPVAAATTPVKPPTPAPVVASVADEPPPLTEEQKQILHMVDESFQFMPESSDSEKPNRYTPRNPYAAPAAFPSTPSALFDRPAVFEKLDVDTLFFIFYYQQGSYQQYLAARELKRRTWGYHKKYKTWFKRHEEPQITGDDYEQGTFVYFDYETGWCQRIKTEFMFEYSYLEDELQ